MILYNAEDRRKELQRRLLAAISHYGTVGEFRQPTHLISCLDDELIVRERRGGDRGPLERASGAEQLTDFVRETGAVLVVLNPQVSSSRGLFENSTDDMNALMQTLARDANMLGVAYPSSITPPKSAATMPATSAPAAAGSRLIARRGRESRPLHDTALGRPIEWNDRLQQFIDEPVIRKGLREGVELQRLESLADGSPFEPLDFAITDFDETG